MIRKSILFVAILALFFASCQKEEVKIEPKEESTAEETKVIDAEKSFPVTKGPAIVKYDTKYVMDGSGVFNSIKTMKIRKLDWSIAQEWLFVDLNTKDPVNGGDLFQNVSYYTGDTYGAVHGCYYPWNQIEDTDIWKYILGVNIFGDMVAGDAFRIPKIDTEPGANDGDITKLAMILGATSLIPKKLNLEYDGTASDFSDKKAYMWLDWRGTYFSYSPPNYGVLGNWDSARNDYYSHTVSNFSIKANVRLVRDITRSEW